MNLSEKILHKHKQIKVLLLEFSILKMLIFNKHPLYGKEILLKLEKSAIPSHEGTIYPILSRMRRDQLLESYIEESDVGPPRKYYYLTKIGTKYYLETQSFLRNFAG